MHRRDLIFLNYAKGMAVIDIVSTIPFDFFASIVTDGSSTSVQNLAFLRTLRVLRLTKLLRVLRSSRVLRRLEDHIYFHYRREGSGTTATPARHAHTCKHSPLADAARIVSGAAHTSAAESTRNRAPPHLLPQLPHSGQVRLWDRAVRPLDGVPRALDQRRLQRGVQLVRSRRGESSGEGAGERLLR